MSTIPSVANQGDIAASREAAPYFITSGNAFKQSQQNEDVNNTLLGIVPPGYR